MSNKSKSVPSPPSNGLSTSAAAVSSAPDASLASVPTSIGSVAPPPFARNPPQPQSEDTDIPAEPSNENSVLIPIQYELYSNFRNRPTVQDTITLPSTLSPIQFRSCIAEAMGLEPGQAHLAYTIFGVAKAQPKCVFNTEIQVKEAIKKVEGVIQRARSVKKGLSVVNLASDPVLKDGCKESTPSGPKPVPPKAKLPGKLSKHESVELQKAMRLKATIVKLRARLRCQLCHGQFCYVEPRGGRHIRCTHEMLTLWAKQHIETPDIVTLNRPPNIRLFDPSRGLPLAKTRAKAVALGSTTTHAIFVSDNTPPPVKQDPDMDVIDIASDSGSSIDLIDCDPLPDPAELAFNQPTAPNHATTSNCPTTTGCPTTHRNSPTPDVSLVQFLYDLHMAFPSLNFISFHPQLESVGVYTVQDLAVQSVYWIVDSVRMSTAQAMITLGAAMSIAGKDGVVRVDIKGKGKAKDEFEY